MSTNSKKLTGKVAVVTGASKGIGAEIAKQLANEGAAVIVNYASSKTGAEAVVNEITANGGKALAVQANVSNKADIQRLFAATKQEFGVLDILVNNAGMYENLPLEAITEEHFHKQFDLNVLGAAPDYAGRSQALRPVGAAASSSSAPSSAPCVPRTLRFTARPKAAVDSVTRSLAKELGPRNIIRVNSINPGMVETEGLHSTGIMCSRAKPGGRRAAGQHRATTGTLRPAWSFSLLPIRAG